MDISNATAAGPSYGLLDVIFGTKPEEAEQGDGKQFQPLMNLIQSLKKKGTEEEAKLEGSRTEKETATGKDAADSRVVGIPEMFASIALLQQQGMAFREALAQGVPMKEVPAKEVLLQAMAGAKAAARLPADAPPLGELDLKSVNAMLREKSLPPLNEAEAKLLGEVNAKMARADRDAVLRSLLGEQPPAPSEPKTADSRQDVAAERLMQALSARGIDPEKLKSVEASAPAASEKFMNTETYLKMHESLGQQSGKKALGADKNSKMEIESDPRWSPAQAARESVAKQGGEQPKGDLFGGSAKDMEKLLEGADRKASRESTMPFAASLVQHLKSGSALEAKDVYLDGTRPEEMRAELMGEVTSGVHLHAVRGGGEMKLVIHPEEMGEVKLKIAAAKDGKVEVHVTAESNEVADLIRSGSSDLKASLGDQNLQLTRFEVTVSDQSVSSLEQKGSLSEQLLQQNPSGFQQPGAGSDDSRFARWEGQGEQRQGPEALASEQENRGEPARKSPVVRHNPVRDNSHRLDVVA